MIRRLGLAVLIAVLSAGAADAAGVTPTLPQIWKPASGAFVGALQTADHFWGLRAYSAANIGQNIVRLRRASDSTEQDFTALASGYVDTASASTFCNATTCYVRTLYDQTGGALCTGAAVCHMNQATTAKQPEFVFNCRGSHPCMRFNTSTDNCVNTVARGTSQAQPYTYSVVAILDYAGGVNDQHVVMAQGNTGVNPWIDYLNTTQLRVKTGSTVTATYAEATWYAVQALFNGASSVARLNGSETSGNAGTGSVNTGAHSIGGPANCGGSLGTGAIDVLEAAFFPSEFDATERAAMETNQRAAWGF